MLHVALHSKPFQVKHNLLPHLDPEGIEPKTDGTAEIYAPFYLYIIGVGMNFKVGVLLRSVTGQSLYVCIRSNCSLQA